MPARLVSTVLLALSLGVASAQCLSSAFVTATALGAANRNAEMAMSDAVQAALNDAITQVRGVYVTSSSLLWEEFSTDTAATASSLDLATGFSHELSSRFSGFIESYEVVDRRSVGGGAVEVTVAARVCLDERIAIGLPDGAARSAILNSLIGDITAAGWQVIYDSPGQAISDRDLLEFTLATGVTYIAQGSLHSSLGESHGMVSANLSMTMNLLDTRTRELAHSFTGTHSGVGVTSAAAIQMAGERVGTDLARAWNQAFLQADQRTVARFVFRGLRRAGTRHTIGDIVAALPGVLTVNVGPFDQARGEAVLELELAADACAVAREVPMQRRVLSELVTCEGNNAVFSVRGD